MFGNCVIYLGKKDYRMQMGIQEEAEGRWVNRQVQGSIGS